MIKLLSLTSTAAGARKKSSPQSSRSSAYSLEIIWTWQTINTIRRIITQVTTSLANLSVRVMMMPRAPVMLRSHQQKAALFTPAQCTRKFDKQRLETARFAA
nr:hypothetical protein [Pusillimonas sp. NJUB218]